MTIKLFFAGASPYVRKVMVCAHELGLAETIERVPVKASPAERDEQLGRANPLAKIPAAVTETAGTLYDSRVICEYLDTLSDRAVLFPAPGPARWETLTLQSLADGLLDAALLTRYERVARPDAYRWDGWADIQLGKITAALDAMELGVGAWGGRFDIGRIASACALGYLDYRFAGVDWRATRPALSAWFATVGERPSLAATMPTG